MVEIFCCDTSSRMQDLVSQLHKLMRLEMQRRNNDDDDDDDDDDDEENVEKRANHYFPNNKGRRTQNRHNTPCEAYLHIMPTFIMVNVINMINMTNMMVVINMMNMLFRLDQQKEKALVAAYSNAGNPVSGLLTG